jgi:DNA ligase D-like protein (predicted ligase)
MTSATWQEPMLAQLLRMPDDARILAQGDWIYERKFDGLRCLAVRNGTEVELWSRNRLSFTGRFPEVAAALRTVPADNFVIDGEVVAFAGNRTSFGLLQQAESGAHAVYVVFDVLHLLGRDTRGLPLGDRTSLLAQALEATVGDVVRTSERLDGEPVALLAAACRDGWEGLIAKRAGSSYRPGRSGDWRKLKCLASQELVIGGWTDPSGARTGFGAVLVGYYDSSGAFRYAGRVGTGFDAAELRDLYRAMRERAMDQSPFADPVPAKGTHWVRPELVAQVAFGEWTRDGRLRHPRYEGLRPDKPARDVRREVPPD